MYDCKKRDNPGFDDAAARSLTILLSWLNLIVHFVAIFSVLNNITYSDAFLLPLTIVILTLVIALTLLAFCCLDIKRLTFRIKGLFGIIPSLVILVSSLYMLFVLIDLILY